MMNLLSYKVIHVTPNSFRKFKMAAITTIFNNLITDNLCVFSILVVLICILIHISTDASTLSTTIGTFQPALRQEQRRVSHPILQLHRTTYSNAFGATSISHYMGTSLPFSVFHPKFCGCRCGPSLDSPFHICTWRYTRRLWYLAADDVGGRFSGCTNRVLVANFWCMRSNLNLSSVSPTAPVYRHTSDASPELDLSASVAFSCGKTSACVMKCLSERICFRASPFPMLNTREVASQPRMAWANNIIVANCTSQHSLHILDVPASWTVLCSGPDLWFEEDFARIFHDMQIQKHKQIRVIANKGNFARHCKLYSGLWSKCLDTSGWVSWSLCICCKYTWMHFGYKLCPRGS